MFETLFDIISMEVRIAFPVFLLTLLSGVSIPILPILSGFFPKIGLVPLKLGHDRRVRLFQALTVWGFALAGLWFYQSVWGWISVGLALWFSFVVANFYSERIFVALDQPARSQTGLAEAAPVLATEVGREVVAYPLEMVVPHHLVNDVIGENRSWWHGERLAAAASCLPPQSKDAG